MSESYKCFLLVPSGRTRRSLRRYNGSGKLPCPGMPGQYSYHNAGGVFLDIIEDPEHKQACGDLWPHDDPRWPTKCDLCSYQFTEADDWQLFCQGLFRRADTGEEMALREAPTGAMWYADWNTLDVGPDGRCLVVKCPGNHDWTVDSECSNCTRKGDRSHKCWVRHGEPPLVTVDKKGNTCAAGAGSILVPGWHGFLKNGVLVPC